jgi:cellobiose phosphorylase
MQYGHFDDDAKEYLITRPDTPQSWSNYLGSTEYGAIITNNAGGYGFYQSGARGRLLRLRFNSVPTDQPGRYLYLRDQESGDYWSASWQPVGKPLEQYQSTCRHGTAYTVIEARYSGIHSEAICAVRWRSTWSARGATNCPAAWPRTGTTAWCWATMARACSWPFNCGWG